MKPDSQNIEEKLIPYLEGVLNPKERREVEEAINSDPELAREMSELRELILELRQGFATGLKPPQEELSPEEVVELSLHSGPAEKLPGSSAQKARLFCSDTGLDEYTLLRTLSEEMSRTTLDRENVPELPSYLRQEFQKLKGTPTKGKVVPFLKPSFASNRSTVSLWRRASGWLDRVDPKPLMASAAALAMLSFGVHLYNRPATTPASQEVAVVAPTVDSAKAENMTVMGSSAGKASPAIEGVAVFTSDDRNLLKEQAEKLLSKKVRYTVTKDRILVAEKDVAMAREILWEDAEGKAVAMAKEEPESRRMARTVDSAQGSGAVEDSSPYVQEVESAGFSPPSSDSNYDRPAAASGDVTVYNNSGRRSDAPAPVRAPRPSNGNNVRRGAAGVLPGYGDDGIVRSAPTRGARSEQASQAPPSPSQVAFPPVENEPSLPPQLEPPPKPSVVRPPTSAARKQQIKDLALGDSRSEDASSTDEYSVAGPETAGASVSAEEAPGSAVPTQQKTSLETRARVSTPNAAVAASAPAVTRVDAQVSAVDSRFVRIQSTRQSVAQRHSVELSFEKQSEKIVVYVRPSKALDKAQLDELRKALRKDLGLAESDTLIFR